jgi:hypothetical protein
MLDPTESKPELDYREFGDMFFDLGRDPLEMNNGINDPAYDQKIRELRKYYEEFVENTPATGKKETIASLIGE